MTLIVCNGLPKSASSFAYQMSTLMISDHFGEDPETTTLNYKEDLLELDANLKEVISSKNLTRTIKTHGPGPLDTFDLLESGQIKCVYTLRDPVDMALSYIEAGRMEEALGKNRFFNRFKHSSQTVQPIKFAFTKINLWSHPKTKFLHFSQLASNKRRFLESLYEYLIEDKIPKHLLEKYLNIPNSDILEFNKGETGRGLKVFSKEEIEDLESRLYVELLFSQRMEKYLA